ncbi:hypothetical protein RRG08_064891 [Elysia crispata]|uniref:Uncharacterized protein n=1 Tax=Elysia crispata TaxID=231223 RepID=A0AAE0YX76_9GAST|nr:hypothetical protein RRG08_064891 [Elysia crispata]
MADVCKVLPNSESPEEPVRGHDIHHTVRLHSSNMNHPRTSGEDMTSTIQEHSTLLTGITRGTSART